MNFKTFQVYSSSFLCAYILAMYSISKLFKFTVHLIFSCFLIFGCLFQNFSSLQFMKCQKIYKNTMTYFKTFQVYSSLFHFVNQKLPYSLFQNFSSLQFIRKYTNSNFPNFRKISKLFKFTVHFKAGRYAYIVKGNFKTFQVYSS